MITYWDIDDVLLAYTPLDQFEIKEFISLYWFLFVNIKMSLTNIGLYLIISVWLLFTISLLTSNNNKILPNKWSIWQESLYQTIHNIIINQIDKKKGEIFFPFMFCLFNFILINNIFGMIPYSFASTSHFFLTFTLSFTIVIGATILGFKKYGFRFFSLLVPAGCPLGLLPLLVLIELISYLSRNVSLGLRLAANILSGHMLLNILSGFTYNIMTSGFRYIFISIFPLLFVIAFSGLEFAIAFIQTQVFVVLSCSYIKDALELH